MKLKILRARVLARPKDVCRIKGPAADFGSTDGKGPGSATKSKNFPTVHASLRDALDNLDGDRAFLKKGDVFNDSQINAVTELKMGELKRFEAAKRPVEFAMNYSSWPIIRC